MKIIDLTFKWKNIKLFKAKKGYKAIRINSTCLPDLFLAIDGDGFRCLILFLPESMTVKMKEVDKNRLSMSFISNKAVLIIKLKDFEFVDLFDDLTLSIFSKISSISDSERASDEFIKTFYKWAHFFEDSPQKKLSDYQIQGLFGELFVLRNFLKDSDKSNIDLNLNSWRGLYDSANDFEFDFKNIEVKSIKDSNHSVNISSEYQLEQEEGKGLEMLIVSLKTDLVNGQSLYDIILEILDLIRFHSGDLSILYQALNQKGLTIRNLKQYNNHRFIVIKTQSYDVTNDDFPKLTKSNIKSEISNLKYDLRIDQLAKFSLELKNY
jgi:hypothetical protein